MKHNRKYRIIDLFAGAGGLSLGFTEYGLPFETVWANDNIEDCVKTYNTNFPGNIATVGDIVDIVEMGEFKIPEADVVIGGPPCQGFSLLNRNRDGDLRKQMWRPYMEVVRRSKAKVFVMENVPQLLKSEEFNQILEEAHKLGFNNIAYGVLFAPDYGVPQIRKRAIIIGSKTGDPKAVFPPLKTHRDPKKPQNGNPLPKWVCVRDVIADLPEPVGTEIRNDPPPLNLHFGRTPTEVSMRRYMTVSEEGMNRFDLQRLAPDLTPACWIRKKSGGTDLFGRLWWDRPAFTIRTEFFKPEKGRYLHPKQHRPITHREAARIQTFPDSFRFCGSKIEVARQIGNAVPPKLAKAVAESVFALLKSIEDVK